MNALARSEAKSSETLLSLASFKGVHQGDNIVVCGCGESVNALQDPTQFITIGVNDIGRRFHPDYLVVVNPRNQFKPDRFRYVETSQARYLFTQYDDLSAPHPQVVRIQLGKYGGTDFGNPDVLHFTQNSPYVALCLAIHMGARRIGLIGVDFTENHFFAKTGRHPLAARLEQIDREYSNLAQACRSMGIEVFNLSPVSRLTAFPRAGIAEFLALPKGAPSAPVAPIISPKERRVFVVNYRFLSCGDVFADGLRHAAAELGHSYQEALWDDPQLPAKVDRFGPEVIFVVHGRRFVQKWNDRFRAYNTAVWLVDEPYEVDDTARWSRNFTTVFVNDPNTIHHHHNAHYLPVCHDPRVHQGDGRERIYKVGFIGGFNATRERYLLKLADAGLLGYVVGGPWKAPALRKLCLAQNIPPQRTAELYRQTEIVLNVFREVHHYNSQGIPAFSMNPRIYEALACGAAVVSERRAEVGAVFPELPQFDSLNDLVATATDLLADRQRLASVRAQCQSRVAQHTYSNRLAQVLRVTLADRAEAAALKASAPAPTISAAPASNQARPRPPQALEPLPFRVLPRRNLIYHVWPVRGSMWKWNLDEIKRRIDLFNGRRIVGIVYDDRSENPDAVQEYLDGHGCEFVVAPNDERGEALTFPAMLERVASKDPDELTFYAHAKGVKYGPTVAAPVRRWAEVQYRVTLDDWLAVREQMQRFAMTGIFKLRGRFRTHRLVGDWHYSGTFFWMRHAHVFSRRYQDVPAFYAGVEAWPGLMFHESETGCLFMDKLNQLPYQEQFWRKTANPAFRLWESKVRQVPVPTDLAHPLPIDGYSRPRTEQKPEELSWWIRLLLEHQATRLLTIGSMGGGTEWHVARVFHEQGRKIAITAIDSCHRQDARESIQDARNRFGQALEIIVGDSSSAEVRGQLADSYDAVFIDGDHTYRACRGDFLLAKSLGARLVGLHDIVDSDWHAHNRCCVSRLWTELVQEYETEEMKSSEWGGIGVVKLRP